MYLASYRLQSRIAGANRCWIFYLPIHRTSSPLWRTLQRHTWKGLCPSDLYSLPIIPKLERLFGDLTEYFREQPNTCSRYLDVKCQEIIYILTCYYPIQQVSTFFYPISTYTESFHYFVMQNYDKVKNVEEFAHLGGYTTTTFRRLFKNMYGVPVYEWILDKNARAF